MKKITVTILFACFMLAVGTVYGQYSVKGERQKIVVHDDDDDVDVVDISSSNQNNLSVKLVGFEVMLGGNHDGDYHNNDRRNNRYRHNNRPVFVSQSYSHWGLLELGFSQLARVSYPFPDESYLDLNVSKSNHVALNIATASLGRPHGTFKMSTGFAVVFENYAFSNDISLVDDNGVVSAIPIEPRSKKTKLTTAAFRVPLYLDATVAGDFFISAGVYGEVVVSSFTKVKFPKDKVSFNSVTPLRAGASVRMGFTNTIYVFGDYGFSQLFDGKSVPSAQPVAVGVGVCMDF